MNDQEIFKEYLRQKEQLDTLEADGYKSLDKTLLVLSSGAISLSMTFVDKLQILNFTYLLKFSWIFWLLSIFAQLTSLYLTPKAMRKENEKLNEQFETFLSSGYTTRIIGTPPPRGPNVYQGWPTRFSYIAMITFGLGVLSFIIFVITNTK